MKYKVGDKVKLIRGGIWDPLLLIEFDKLPDKVATIKEVEKIMGLGELYHLEELDYLWSEGQINYLIARAPVEPIIEYEIFERYEILDLRKEQ